MSTVEMSASSESLPLLGQRKATTTWPKKALVGIVAVAGVVALAGVAPGGIALGASNAVSVSQRLGAAFTFKASSGPMTSTKLASKPTDRGSLGDEK